jgi:hypothetical protein
MCDSRLGCEVAHLVADRPTGGERSDLPPVVVEIREQRTEHRGLGDEIIYQGPHAGRHGHEP